MNIELKDGVLHCRGTLTVEDAETLLSTLCGDAAGPAARIDLSACVHIHAASLQVLMAAAPAIVAWPDHAALAAWLRSALTHTH